jgi:hypothetical protein
MTAVTTLERDRVLEQGHPHNGSQDNERQGLPLQHSLPKTPGLGEGLSLDEAHQRVIQDDKGKWDTLVYRDALDMREGSLAFPAHGSMQQLPPSSWATGQLCARLGIPAAYFRKCPSHLQDTQANYWLREGIQKEGEQWLLRARDHELRAVLSERYSPLDNHTLLDELHTLLPSHYRVDWFGLSDESLHLRVVDPARYREVLPDDALTVGIHLANSEVVFAR